LQLFSRLIISLIKGISKNVPSHRGFWREAMALKWDNTSEPSDEESTHETPPTWIIRREERAAQLTKMGVPLMGLKARIDWEAFRPELKRVHEKDKKVRRAPSRSMGCWWSRFWCSNTCTIYQMMASAIRFGIGSALCVVWVYNWKIAYRIRKRCGRFAKGLRFRLGWGVVYPVSWTTGGARLRGSGWADDCATFVEVPKQRNTRAENAQIKAGQVPEAWDKPEAQAKRRQKDTEARWTKKNDEKHYGYKSHINADAGNKLIPSYAVTHAAVHDSQVFDELLDQAPDVDGNKRAVYCRQRLSLRGPGTALSRRRDW
jgi:IS5 family transposase